MNRNQLADQSGGNALTRYDASFEQHSGGNAEEATPNVFASIWRWRWAVLSITILSVIGAVIFLRLMPASYNSTAKLTITAPPNPMANSSASPADSGDVFLHQQCSIMSSAVVCDAAVKALRPFATQDELHEFSVKLQDHLMTDVGRQDNVILLSYTDKTGDDAANIVNAIEHAYDDYVTKKHGDTSHGTISILTKEKEGSVKQHSDIQDQIADLRAKNPKMLFTAPNGMNDADTEVGRLYSAKTDAMLAEATAEAQFNTASHDHDQDDQQKLEQYATQLNFISPDTTQEIIKIRANLEAVNTQLLMLTGGGAGPSSPLVKNDKLLIIELTAKLQFLTKKLTDEFLSNLEEAKLQAQEKIKAIDAQIAASEVDAAKVNSVQAVYQRLLAEDAGVTKQIADLTDTINKQEVGYYLGQVPTIGVLQQARGDDAVRIPDPARVLVLTLCAGLAIGIGFALLRDKLDQRVRSAEEIASLLGLPVVGVVPHMKRGLTPLARAQAVHWDPMSEVSEAYRAVRTAVHFGVQAGEARTIIVTSPTPGDGKSTLASNLAISFAQAGKHTLLLDADFRRPVQHRMFEIKDESGLTAVLAGHEPLSKAIRRTVVEGLDLLPAGPLPLNPSELLNGDSFAAILEELSQKYDHIVLDCPPVIAVTDARILGALCDLALLVLRAGKTTRQGAELARSGLMSVGSRLLGVVVNDVPRGEEQYGYYGSYAYHGNGNERARLTDEISGTSNGHSSGTRRRLPSPSGVDSMQ
jgi:polysaccharide biosynthesis transport protein